MAHSLFAGISILLRLQKKRTPKNVRNSESSHNGKLQPINERGYIAGAKAIINIDNGDV